MKKNNDESLSGNENIPIETVHSTEEHSTNRRLSTEDRLLTKEKQAAGERLSAEKPSSLEESFLQIEEIIARMESQDVTLDESFTLYQQGIGKLKNCSRMLDEVEKKMLVLNAEGELEEMP